MKSIAIFALALIVAGLGYTVWTGKSEKEAAERAEQRRLAERGQQSETQARSQLEAQLANEKKAREDAERALQVAAELLSNVVDDR